MPAHSAQAVGNDKKPETTLMVKKTGIIKIWYIHKEYYDRHKNNTKKVGERFLKIYSVILSVPVFINITHICRE